MSSSSVSATTAPTPAPLPPYKKQTTLSTTPSSIPAGVPHLPSEISLKDISFSDLKTNQDRRTVYINYKETGRLPMLETPWLETWGVESSAKFADTAGEPKLSMRLSLDPSPSADDAGRRATLDLRTFLEGMDHKMTRLAVDRAMELFKKRALDETTVREAMLNTLVKTSERGRTTFKVHFSNYAPPEVYTQSREVVPESDWETVLVGKMRVRAILACRPLWFIAGTNKFGCKWEVKQLLFEPLETRLSFASFQFDTGAVPTTVDVPAITFTDVKVNPNTNSKSVYLNAPGGGPLLLQTGWLTSFDGVAPPAPEYVKEGETPRCTLKWSLKNEGEAETTLREMLQAIDAHILTHAQEHSQKLFKRKMSREVVQALYTPIVNETYPAFKVKTPHYDDGWAFAAYSQGERFEDDLDQRLGARLTCRGIVQCRGLWFLGGRFGCSWQMKQLEFEPPRASGLASYAFRDATPLLADEPGDDATDTAAAIKGTDEVVESDEEVVDSDME